MRRFLLGMLVGVVFCGLALVILIFAAARLASRPPAVADDSILVLKVSGEVPEAPQVEFPFPMFARLSPPTVRDHWETLKKAAADSRIRAIVLIPEDVRAGWAKLDELRSDIEGFRKSGKPVYAYLRSPGTREYYLAAAADRIYMAPEDYLDLKGLRAELMYVKGTLDKLGVQIEVEHAGKYKDAPDMFTRTSMSPETREVMNSVLDDVYGQLTGAIARARRKTPEQIRSLIDEGPFLAGAALNAGLVDALRYQDQVYGELKDRLKLREVRKISDRDYLRVPPESVGVGTGSRIALVIAEGDIVRGDGAGDGFVTPAAMAGLLRRAGEDRAVRGVIVRIDSPGGDGFASDEIWREMQLLSKKKPLVLSMSDMAASGGYYIAMTGDPVIAYPGTYTGSIGVFFGKADLRGLYGKLGITKELLSRGKFAEIDSDYKPLSEAERAKLRQSIDAFYASFVGRVAEARKRPYGQVEPLAQGRVWMGDQAKANGLVDELGGLDRAIEILRKKAGISDRDQVRLVSFPPRRSILDQLFRGSDDILGDMPALALLRRYSTSTWRTGGFFRMVPYRIEIR
jgi:protease IV